MRRIVILLTLFITIFSSSLASQTLSEDQSISREGYIPGELIIHSSSPQTPQNIEAFFQMWNIPVIATQLTYDRTYFLVRLDLSGTRPSTRLEMLYETLVDQFVCEGISSNPGEGSTFEVDGIWPNYVVDSGDEYVNNSLEEEGVDLCVPVDEGSYNPLKACPDNRELPAPLIGSKSVHVAIMDTGLDLSDFSYLFSHPRTGLPIVSWHQVDAADYLNQDPETDVNGHGTAVAALIAHRFYEAGKLNRLKLHSFPILDERGAGTIAGLINALDLAITHEVDIINLSLGFVGEDCDEYVSNILAPLFTRAYEADILIFASAGNDGAGLAEHAQYPANSSPSSSKIYTVGASNCGNESTWSESNFDVNIVDFTAPGQDIIVPYTRLNCYVKASGTSFATPLSASIAAAMLSRHSLNRTICFLESRLTPTVGTYVPGTDESRLGSITFLGNDFVEECYGDVSTGLLMDDSGTSSPFPNPVGSVLNVPVTEEEIAANSTLRINDLGGRKLFQAPVHNSLTKVSTENMPAGVYFLYIINKEKTRITKIIKR